MGTGKRIEGYWDCPQCGTKKIKGRYRYCNSCGKPRGKETKFYMIETDNYVEDPDAFSNEPDWYCSYCQSLNPSGSSCCESCGSSQEDSDKNYFDLLEEERLKQLKREEEKNNYFENDDIVESSSSDEIGYSLNEDHEYNNKPIRSHDDKRKLPIDFGWLIKLTVVFSYFFIVIALLFSFIMPKEASLKVTDKSWERSIEVQEYKTIRENDWSVPTGGRVAYTQDEVHHKDKVIDHYKTVTVEESERYISGYDEVVTGYRDLGNGSFDEITENQPVYDIRYWTEEKQEPVYEYIPVYQTKYYYDIDRWVHKGYEKTSGSNDDPYWAKLNLVHGVEREGNRTETYKILTEDQKGKAKTYTLSFETWSQIEKGDVLKVKVSAGMISEIISIN